MSGHSCLNARPVAPDKPTTPGEWIIRWQITKEMTVPSRNGTPKTIQILYASNGAKDGTRTADSLVSHPNEKHFFVLFSDAKNIEPYSRPCLVIPGCDPARARWLMPNR